MKPKIRLVGGKAYQDVQVVDLYVCDESIPEHPRKLWITNVKVPYKFKGTLTIIEIRDPESGLFVPCKQLPEKFYAGDTLDGVTMEISEIKIGSFDGDPSH